MLQFEKDAEYRHKVFRKDPTSISTFLGRILFNEVERHWIYKPAVTVSPMGLHSAEMLNSAELRQIADYCLMLSPPNPELVRKEIDSKFKGHNR